MRRRAIPFALVGALSVLALASMLVSLNSAAHLIERTHHSSAPSGPIGAPQYGFGGYQYYPSDPVTSVSGEWNVPVIAASSNAGDASTWIGAQSVTGAFAQIGTVENQFAQSQYYAFWSTTAKGFLPQFVLPVSPGDEVRASMTMGPRGWNLTLSDLTSRTSKTVHTAYGSRDAFNSCEWFQENPVYSQFVHTSYPSFSTVSFHGLRANGAVPSLSYNEAQTLSTSNDSFFVPTRVRDDRFSLLPATGYALNFLTSEYLEEELGADFFESASQGIEPSTVLANSYIAGLGLDLPILKSQTWPAPVSRAVKRYVRDEEHLESYMQRWMNESNGERRSNLVSVQHQLATADHFADRVRYLLGLPPVFD